VCRTLKKVENHCPKQKHFKDIYSNAVEENYIEEKGFKFRKPFKLFVTLGLKILKLSVFNDAFLRHISLKFYSLTGILQRIPDHARDISSQFLKITLTSQILFFVGLNYMVKRYVFFKFFKFQSESYFLVTPLSLFSSKNRNLN
jgi:hypothetical protein